MNIQHLWPTDPIDFTLATIGDLVAARRRTFIGFADIEQKNGGPVRPNIGLNSALGQEALRILGFRVLEELSESMLAEDPDHKAEELIDAFNYLISIPHLDDRYFSEKDLTQMLWNHVFQPPGPDPRTPIPISHDLLGRLTVRLTGELSDYLRNRTWMNNSQDYYFAGAEKMRLVVLITAGAIYDAFPSYDTFMRFFIAKDRVLQFRLRTNY